ncbi:HET-domain-containing protein [Nemania serpens]|nr:HET-domain-containing protein [Nemania serpens]
MRLINTQNFDLEEFQNEDDLEYAILSHRWEDGEVTLQDVESGRAESRSGYTKIKKCCEQARRDGWLYLWVDTCCIDKKSSAELSEAINSMYRWYQKAQVCYAFLSDVGVMPRPPDSDASFGNSLWFTRGWTLQELLAPKAVSFYDHSWQLIGTKQNLRGVIHRVTGIAHAVLDGRTTVHDCSIAERMSWAAARQTTRVEDRAYSLLGLFDVNMPMLYGEGEKAFIRLQEEIIRHSDDHSIFAWSMPPLSKCRGLLAPSPDLFANRMHLWPEWLRNNQSSCTITNRGLSISLLLTPWAADIYLALLQCRSRPPPGSGPIRHVGIFLRRLRQDDQYARVALGSRSLIFFDKETVKNRPFQSVAIHVKQYDDSHRAGDRIYGYLITIPELESQMEGPYLGDLVEVPYSNKWDPETCIMTMSDGAFGTTGVVDLRTLDTDLGKVKLGFDFDHNPLLFVIERERLDYESLPIADPTNMEPANQSIIFDTSNCLDDHGLSIASPPNGSFQRGQKGLWAIRGDRLDGLRVGLITSNRARGSPVWFDFVTLSYRGKVIWSLKISGLRPPPVSSTTGTQLSAGSE